MKPEANQDTAPLLRAGDTVRHRLSNETWVLAVDQLDDRVFACGWPSTMEYANQCELLTRATEEQRIKQLELSAKSSVRHLASAAKAQLVAEGKLAKGKIKITPHEEYAKHEARRALYFINMGEDYEVHDLDVLDELASMDQDIKFVSGQTMYDRKELQSKLYRIRPKL